jgi:hypothetical protein
VSEEIVVLLRESPSRIEQIIAGLTAAELCESPGPDTWSANELLAHLRSCADVWGGYIRRLIDEDRPKFRAVSPRGWVDRTNYRELEFEPSFRAFEAQRVELLTLLECLDSRDWSRSAQVTRSGKVATETILSFAERLARHEHHHLDQFARIARALRGAPRSG